MTKNPAFTLIELLVASTIIIILMGIGVASFRSAGQQARNARRAADMEALKSAQIMNRTERNVYADAGSAPVSAANITAAVTLLGTNGYWNGPPLTAPAGGGYSGTDTTTTFCYCAQLEPDDTTRGNSTTNACAWGAGEFYCVRNP